MGNSGIPETFDALRAHESAPGRFELRLETVSRSVLPESGVPVRVEYSSLNYKDALSASGVKGISRSYPHTPGIDAAGYRLDTGEPVAVIGFDLGMNTPGGLARYIRVPEEWLVRIPKQIDLWTVMALGTAGITALIAARKLLVAGLSPEGPPLVVNGASGGVGSLATLILGAKGLGFKVHAQTGSTAAAGRLRELGAASTGPADEFLAVQRALPQPQFAGGLDSLGGRFTAGLLKHIHFNGALAICGNIGGNELGLASFPFILRGVSLIGVASADTDAGTKADLLDFVVRKNLAEPGLLERIARTIDLEDAPRELEAMLAGASSGRLVVRI